MDQKRPEAKEVQIELKSIRRVQGDPPSYDGAGSCPRGRDNPAYDAKDGTWEGRQSTGAHMNDVSVEILQANGIRKRGSPDEVTHAVPKGDGMKLEFDLDQYEESSDDEEDEYDHKLARAVGTAQRAIWNYFRMNKIVFWIVVAVVLTMLYTAYFLYAIIKFFDKSDEEMVRLLWFTVFVACFAAAKISWDKSLERNWDSARMSEKIRERFERLPHHDKVGTIVYWFLVIGTTVFFIIFVIVDIAIDHPDNLRSAFGMAVFVLLFYIFSYKPSKVQFRPVFWGLALQFYFALLILRTTWGYNAFDWLGKRVSEFLAHTDAGSIFVFGEAYTMHFFALKVLTVIIFFSSFISMLYYAGVMQFVIRHIARFLAFCLGTSPTESLNAAGNIFIGQSEAPLMIRPFLKEMTRSEIHAVCTGGFATIAGSVMAAYILMGVSPNHLLSASVMSAPAALAMAKLFWPETKKSKANADAVYNMARGTEHNIIEAASNGASISIKLISNVAVNLIAFIAILNFVNETLRWFGKRVHMTDPELTFSLVCSYLFYPIPWLMGCDTGDVFKVASLIGTKTFLNEFVAYKELSVYIKNRAVLDKYAANPNATWSYISDGITLGNGTTLAGGIISDRSTVIATYALCGFSNLTSIGIMIGALGAMAPNRKKDITKVVVRAMIAGNVACFMTACIAGLLYKSDM
ncbi:solute carrier family 28 member 3-like [Dreissena polymorpha]|nr:solute carrier family 28 member 3-like [Dreissena polymorpha]